MSAKGYHDGTVLLLVAGLLSVTTVALGFVTGFFS